MYRPLPSVLALLLQHTMRNHSVYENTFCIYTGRYLVSLRCSYNTQYQNVFPYYRMCSLLLYTGRYLVSLRCSYNTQYQDGLLTPLSYRHLITAIKTGAINVFPYYRMCSLLLCVPLLQNVFSLAISYRRLITAIKTGAINRPLFCHIHPLFLPYSSSFLPYSSSFLPYSQASFAIFISLF